MMAHQLDRRRNSTGEKPVLRLVPSLTAPPGERGGMVLTRKFIDGVSAYAERWPGRVEVYLRKEPHAVRQLDCVEVMPGDEDDRYQWYNPDDADERRAAVNGASVLLISLVSDNLLIVREALRAHVPFALLTEFCKRTRAQMINTDTRNPIVRWRRLLWSNQIERSYIDAVEKATGVQCNGYPTFRTYSQLNDNVLLYLDSRITRPMVVSEKMLATRTAELMAGGPLRLVFSGRLVAIKGADDLPKVAKRLRGLNIPFTMDIFGGGTPEFESAMRAAIERENLSDCVRMNGVKDFHSELVPYVQRHADLFVCCHRQGDPSCTYLETLSCGVPIVGYDNDAWRGLVTHDAPGWMTPLNDPIAIADQTAALHRDREALARAASAARTFALDHTFEETMDKRIEHLKKCAGIVATAAERNG